ncbi:fimbrillin family protein [uncultured Prevotella sp.]|uniref:fimbrillin family protein n=1 Tax=uncultured Prevotella sp. TaxID=159272 RepID=UPI00258E042B|nr:fimbrillin family protein [uncultured Prevotella sp.]
MKNLFYPLLFTTALVSAACSNDLENDGNATDPSNKTAISFIAENNNQSVTRAGFDKSTKIAMHIRSNEVGTTSVKETSTLVHALEDGGADYSNIQLDNAYLRYWDDAHGRNSQLSVFAIAIPDNAATSNNNISLETLLGSSSNWNTALDEEIDWVLTSNQTSSDILAKEDLVYSNNIQADKDLGVDGVRSYDATATGTDDEKYTKKGSGQLKFRLLTSESDGPGKFDRGHLEFHHALCRMTVNLKKGEGYGDGTFKFKTGTNVSILKVPTKGLFNIETGVWDTSDKTGISMMAETAKDKEFNPDYAFQAQMVPNYMINSTSTDNVLSFIIDNNQYYITQAQMYAALKDNANISAGKKTATDITMENGRNYVFNITVGKTKIINVTATVVDWVDVKGDYRLDNHHYSFNLYDQGTPITDANSFKFYRYQDATITNIKTDESDSKAWSGNYSQPNNFEYKNGTWETDWFYEDNTKFYHFRTTSYENVTASNYHSDATNGDYFTMTSGAISKVVGKGTDYLWGAPLVESRVSSTPLEYNKESEEGYSYYINPAIGSTNAVINMTQMHMMSNIKIVLKTTGEPAANNNAITLYDSKAKTKGSTIAITNFYTQGDVSMGSGKVSPKNLNTETAGVLITSPSDASADDFFKTDFTETNEFSYSVVPQSLVDGTRKVGLLITTPDKNQYFVVEDLSQIAVSNNGGSLNQGTKIDCWYPGHQYIYTITLTKTGIKNITCSVVGWVDVTAKNQDITLED